MYHLNKYEDAICQSLKKRQIWHLFFFPMHPYLIVIKNSAFYYKFNVPQSLTEKIETKTCGFS